VIPPEDVNFRGVLDFEGKEQTDGFYALTSAIDVVAHEEVGGFRREASILEEAEHVIVLPVDITTDLDGGSGLNKHGLLHEDVFDSPDEAEDIALC
jgi:hypothetical protein